MGIRIPPSYAGWVRKELAFSELDMAGLAEELGNAYVMDLVTTWDKQGEVLEYKQTFGGIANLDGVSLFDYTLVIESA